ncbi:HDOD domain-containing protein [Persicimonas caeni]|uniref:HDOD domain-containing protein n=1 Tax=Persicimonas caeni TaxID=2292766 RepID=A0A4Y6PSZ1_PERCE|nr:HDOD domain-containing protein [Persicimonas caeni]QDG51370.1 HDOD domain-containing protein [Persicimonas caeni]QED32591.1 HDOD domain-containing protein [Persicimonas caeni]
MSHTKHILFVDAEQRALEAIEQVLHRDSYRWNLSFASDGESALELLETDTVDVLVTELALPRLDGVQLLESARQLHPDSIRIVFSGEVELHRILQSSAVAHQALAKPASPRQVRQAIERASQVHEALGTEACRRLVSGADGLPMVPSIYSKLVCTLANPNASMQQVADVISEDVSLCAQILRLVNSAFFGLAREVTTVGDAIRYLGPAVVRDLVLSEEAYRLVAHGSQQANAIIESVRRHSRMTAKVARKLVSSPELAEQAFLAGMLHQVGTLLLAARGEDIESLERPARADAPSAGGGLIARRKEPELDHFRLGAYLLGLWGLPAAIVETVAECSDPSISASTHAELIAAVHVAHRVIANVLPAHDGSEPVYEAPRLYCLERLGLPDAHELTASVRAQISVQSMETRS